MLTESVTTREQVKPPITPQILDRLANEAGLSDEARATVDLTITMVLQGISIAVDGIVHKRNTPDENSGVPRPAIADDPMSVYVLAHLSQRLSDENSR